MKIKTIISLFATAFVVSAIPVSDSIAPREGNDKPKHGRCGIRVYLNETMRRNERNPTSKLQLYITDNVKVLPWPEKGLNKPEWSDGSAIGSTQNAVTDKGLYLNDVIEPGSELQVMWKNAASNITFASEWRADSAPPREDFLNLRYLRSNGAEYLEWNDMDTSDTVEWTDRIWDHEKGYKSAVSCKRPNVWTGPCDTPYKGCGDKVPWRQRSFECTFNC